MTTTTPPRTWLPGLVELVARRPELAQADIGFARLASEVSA